jgi:quercetin dioxygenase-like cupin family protein
VEAESLMTFIDTNELAVKEPLPGWHGRYFHSESMTFGYYAFVRGAAIHPHSHPNEEVWHVIEGELEVTIGDAAHVAGPGGVALVPANTAHAVMALSDGRAIVVDHPRRQSVGAAQTT